MITLGEDVAERARACIGARFRGQGRDAERGLDCVGLAGFAYGVETPRDYRLRGGSVAAVERRIAEMGLARVDGLAQEGDLVLLRAAPTQLHFAVMTKGGFVHADARLRRVVETPGQPRWPVLSVWRREG